MQTISEAGINFIKEFEKFRARPYKDGGDFWTIGYGHKMSDVEIQEIKEVTHEEALEILKLDLQEAEYAVNSLITVPLAQNQFDALVSFAFNVGGGAFEGSTLRKLLNKGFYGVVPEQLNRWVNSSGQRLNGLVRRRKAEGRIFQDGVYDAK